MAHPNNTPTVHKERSLRDTRTYRAKLELITS